VTKIMQHAPVSGAGFGAIIVLFGLLAFAGHGSEFLKQVVLAPGSSAELGIAPDCRADELDEENLTVLECQLLVSNVQMQLASSPHWFRTVQLLLSGVGMVVALGSLPVGFAFVHNRLPMIKSGITCFGLLLALDLIGLIGAASTGPLLRAQYLWPLFLWLNIHLCLLLANWHYVRGDSLEQNN